MKKILIGALFLLGFSSQGQGISVLDIMDNTGTSGSLFRNRVLDKKEEKVDGSPFLNETFMSSSISGVENVFLTRYNAYTDEVEVSYDNSIFVIPKEDRYSTIVNTLGNYKLKLLRYSEGDDSYVYGYLFEVFSGEKLGLYKREQIVLQKAREAVNGYALPIPPKFYKKSEVYFLKLNEEKVIPFPKNKKEIIKIMPSNESAISTYFKENKTSFKSEADLIKLTEFLSTL